MSTVVAVEPCKGSPVVLDPIPASIACPVCKEHLVRPTSFTPCGHRSCSSCEAKTPQTCPVCNEAVRGQESDITVAATLERYQTNARVSCTLCKFKGTRKDFSGHTPRTTSKPPTPAAAPQPTTTMQPQMQQYRPVASSGAVPQQSPATVIQAPNVQQAPVVQQQQQRSGQIVRGSDGLSYMQVAPGTNTAGMVAKYDDQGRVYVQVNVPQQHQSAPMQTAGVQPSQQWTTSGIRAVTPAQPQVSQVPQVQYYRMSNGQTYALHQQQLPPQQQHVVAAAPHQQQQVLQYQQHVHPPQQQQQQAAAGYAYVRGSDGQVYRVPTQSTPTPAPLQTVVASNPSAVTTPGSMVVHQTPSSHHSSPSQTAGHHPNRTPNATPGGSTLPAAAAATAMPHTLPGPANSGVRGSGAASRDAEVVRNAGTSQNGGRSTNGSTQASPNPPAFSQPQRESIFGAPAPNTPGPQPTQSQPSAGNERGTASAMSDAQAELDLDMLKDLWGDDGGDPTVGVPPAPPPAAPPQVSPPPPNATPAERAAHRRVQEMQAQDAADRKTHQQQQQQQQSQQHLRSGNGMGVIEHAEALVAASSSAAATTPFPSNCATPAQRLALIVQHTKSVTKDISGEDHQRLAEDALGRHPNDLAAACRFVATGVLAMQRFAAAFGAKPPLQQQQQQHQPSPSAAAEVASSIPLPKTSPSGSMVQAPPQPRTQQQRQQQQPTLPAQQSTPHSSAPADGAVPSAELQIFWDMDNMPIPSDSNARIMLTGIIDHFISEKIIRSRHEVYTHVYFVDGHARSLSTANKEALRAMGCVLVSCTTRKEDADRQIASAMSQLISFDAKNPVAVISADKDFSVNYQRLRKHGNDVYVVHDAVRRSEHEELLRLYATNTWRMSDIVKGWWNVANSPAGSSGRGPLVAPNGSAILAPGTQQPPFGTNARTPSGLPEPRSAKQSSQLPIPLPQPKQAASAPPAGARPSASSSSETTGGVSANAAATQSLLQALQIKPTSSSASSSTAASPSSLEEPTGSGAVMRASGPGAIQKLFQHLSSSQQNGGGGAGAATGPGSGTRSPEPVGAANPPPKSSATQSPTTAGPAAAPLHHLDRAAMRARVLAGMKAAQVVPQKFEGVPAISMGGALCFAKQFEFNDGLDSLLDRLDDVTSFGLLCPARAECRKGRRCTDLHFKALNVTGTLSLPVWMLVNNAALQKVLDQQSGRAPLEAMPQFCNEPLGQGNNQKDGSLHHRYFRVRGSAELVPAYTLVYNNAVFKALRGEEVEWCTGHQDPITDETCWKLHARRINYAGREYSARLFQPSVALRNALCDTAKGGSTGVQPKRLMVEGNDYDATRFVEEPALLKALELPREAQRHLRLCHGGHGVDAPCDKLHLRQGMWVHRTGKVV